MPKLIDLTGQRFGRLTVAGRAQQGVAPQAYWRCICDCGNEVPVPGYSLRAGNTRSCGCLSTQVKDLTGQRFGRLVVIERVPAPAGKSQAYWLCVCDCGKKVRTPGGPLRDGSTKSCGCLRREMARHTGPGTPQMRFQPAPDDRAWLVAYARQTGRPMYEILTEALAEYRARHTPSARNAAAAPGA